MPLELTKQETADVIPSLQKFCREELEQELSEMRARFLLDYVMKEIAPLAYNRGVRDAEAFFRGKVEDVAATCFEEPMTYWTRRKK